MEERQCLNCQKDFQTNLSFQKFCCVRCLKTYETTNPDYPHRRDIPTGTVGTIGELQVSVDLLDKGYHVFLVLSSHCPSDLVIWRNGRLHTVEVRTAYKTKNRTVAYPKRNIRSDILALVVRDDIVYRQVALEDLKLEELFKEDPTPPSP